MVNGLLDSIMDHRQLSSQIAGWSAAAVVPALIASIQPSMAPFEWLLRSAACVAGLAAATISIWLWTTKPSATLEKFTVKKVRDWTSYDRIEAFRLSQWAALVDGYDYHPDIKDDPGYRPWRNTFFFLKRAMNAGKFGLHLKRANRELLVSREDMQAVYAKVGSRPRAVFPPP